jgi:mono/diheme cytochrome c family protein
VFAAPLAGRFFRMKGDCVKYAVSLLILTLAACAFGAEAAPKAVAAPSLPQNLALAARITADSEYSADYLARFVADGVVPVAGAHDDLKRAWAVRGDTHRGGATLLLEWPEPVAVAEVVYYGRTGWLINECWKTCEVLLDDAAAPVARAALKMTPDPQRIRLPAPAKVRRLALRFTSSHGGPNPGASEVQVFAEPPSDAALAAYYRGQGGVIFAESDALAADIAAGRLGFERLAFIKRRMLNPSHVYTRHCEGFGAGGGLYVLEPPRPDGKATQLVASPDGQILDLDVSHDGREIIFSWRRAEREGYHLWRVGADGSNLTQLTDGPWHDYNACWLPGGGVAFVSSRIPRSPLCFTTSSGVLHRMDRDGGDVRRLSANYVDDFSPAVLPDGRIIFTRWEYVDRPAIPIQSLWTIHPDGTGLRVFFGNRVLSPASFLDAVPVPGTPRVMCTLTAHNGPVRGAVGLLDAERGLNAQTAITNLTPEVNIGRVDKGDGNFVRGPYEQPLPLDERRFLVSRDGAVMLGEIGTGMATLYVAPDGLACCDATPLRPRPRPPVLGTGAAEAQVADASAASPAQSQDDPEAATAVLYLQDVYQGLGLGVARGTVAAIRVVEEVPKPLRTAVLGFGFQRPVISCGATYAVKQVWGTARVEEDGSAYFRVPAGRAIYFIAVDERGVALQRMRSFTQLAAGEVQGCIGCHEPRESAPAVGPRRATALARGPQDLVPPSWGVTGFDYARHVQPVLDRHCVRCHGGGDPAGGVDLAGDLTDWFNVSYETLTRGYVSWIDTRNGQEANILEIAPRRWGSPASRLTDVLVRNHLDKQRRPRFTLSSDERERLLTWIDLNVPYYGTYEMADERRPGGRRVYPANLDKTLADVWQRRCAACHKDAKPSVPWLRLTGAERNPFLAGPLARAAGGRGRCGEGVFTTKDDPDYRAILETINEAAAALRDRPRMDMADAQPDERVDRSKI